MPLPLVPPNLINQNAYVYLTIGDTSRIWCVYAHYWIQNDGNGPPQLQWIGVCQLTQWLIAPDAHLNSEWSKHFQNGVPIMTQLVSVFDDRIKALNYRDKVANITEAWCNKHGNLRERYARVKCHNDGTIYKNAAEAARILKLDAGALSYHLNGRAGYHTVKGLRFEKLKDDQT